MTMTWRPAPGSHAVQFYERTPFLHRAVAAFLAEAIANGEPTAMIARLSTYDAVLAILTSGRDQLPLDAVNRIAFVDATVVHRRIMDGDALLPERFETLLTSLVAELRPEEGRGTLRIYGEVVDLLCKEGNHNAAVRLEALWNSMLTTLPVATLCGYAIEDFDHDVEARVFHAVCGQHTRIIPTEAFSEAPDESSRLQRVALLEQRARTRTSPPAGRGEPAAPGAGTIYVIDDDASVRRALARLLGAMDYQVFTYASAEAFLADVDPRSAGCLVLDVQLVGMSGSELQTRMAAADWRMPVIAMSGSHNQEIEAEAVRLGASAFLGKPFDAQDLLDAVARLATAS